MGYETELTQITGPSGKSFRVYEDASGNIQIETNGTYTTTGELIPSVRVDPVTGRNTLITADGRLYPLSLEEIGVSGSAIVGQLSTSGLTGSAGTVGSAPTTAALSAEVLDDGLNTFKVVNAADSNFALVAFPTMGASAGIKDGRFALRVYIPDYTLCQQIVVYAGVEAALTNHYIATYRPSGMFAYNGWHTIPLPGQWTTGAGAPDWKTIKKIQMRLYPTSVGTVCTWYVGRWEHSWVSRGKLLIIADDGQDTWFSRGVPLLDKFDLKHTVSIIADKIDSGGFVTSTQLSSAYNNGHDISPHGMTGAANNLSELADADAIKAEIKYHKDALLARGYKRGNDLYVYPQGVMHKSAGDTVVFDALNELGFKGARGSEASGQNRHGKHHVAPFKTSSQFWSLSNLGHDSTADGVGSAMVTAVMARIRNLGQYGITGCLMLHGVIAPGATPAGGTQINADDLESLLSEIAKDVRGDLYGYDVVTWSQFKQSIGI